MTLIETLVALSILALLSVAVSGLMQASYRAASAADEILKSTWLAQSVMEQVRARRYDEIQSVEQSPAPDYPGFWYEIVVDSLEPEGRVIKARVKQVTVRAGGSLAGKQAVLRLYVAGEAH